MDFKIFNDQKINIGIIEINKKFLTKIDKL